MSARRPEPWLRGPVPNIPGPLQPAAHALIMSVEDCEAALAGLTHDQLWSTPGGAASVGFHLRHLAGSTDRLFSYARGEQLNEAQRAALAAEADLSIRPSSSELIAGWRSAVEAALAALAATPEATLADARKVGRAGLPSTVLGLLFHAAEHASRHTGQVVTTAKILKGTDAGVR